MRRQGFFRALSPTVKLQNEIGSGRHYSSSLDIMRHLSPHELHPSQPILGVTVSNNPFQAPSDQKHPGYSTAPMTGRGYIQQIPVIASLMIVQGVLYLILALIMFGYAVLFSQIENFVDQAEAAQMQEEFQDMPGGVTFMIVLFFLVGLPIFALAIMHFIAAFGGFKYRYRTFGIVTLIMGLGASLTCYCAPTAIGLGVYGLIIYFNPAVSRAFELSRQGLSKQEILNQFPT